MPDPLLARLQQELDVISNALLDIHTTLMAIAGLARAAQTASPEAKQIALEGIERMAREAGGL